MHSDEELLLTNSSSSSSCEDVWQGEGEDCIRVPSRRVKRHCKVLRQARNWNKNRPGVEEAKRQDLEDELDRERRLVFDLDTRLLQMETERMALLHQLKVAKQMGASLESHLVFLEEHLATQLVNSGKELVTMQMSSSLKTYLVFLEDQLSARLVNSDEEPGREVQLEMKSHQQDGAPRKQTLGESKEVEVKRIDMETQTEAEKEENRPDPEETSMEDDMPNKIVLDHQECRRKKYLGIVTEQLCFASLETLFQELLVHLSA